jgi:hypothetical protein
MTLCMYWQVRDTVYVHVSHTPYLAGAMVPYPPPPPHTHTHLGGTRWLDTARA